MGAALQFFLLLTSWLAALATLLIFLESWFAFSSQKRFAARRASGTYGVVTVFLPLQGSVSVLGRVVRSIFNQSYPFIELILMRGEEDIQYSNFIRDIQGMRTHIPIRVSTSAPPMETEAGRTCALDRAQADARGRWWVVLRSDVILDPFAVESAVEFAGSNDISALSLRPGVRCTSFFDKLIAPSMEYLVQAMKLSGGRRNLEGAVSLDSSFLVLNRETFEAVNRMNRIPGILNEAGWNIWSYQVEGLRTFEGDGSPWMWREAKVSSWTPLHGAEEFQFGWREAVFAISSAFLSLVSIIGLVLGLASRIDSFSVASILAFSAITYLLMATSYFLHARRLRAVEWLAPLWFLTHVPALVLTLIDIRRIANKRRVERRSHAASTVNRS